MTALAHVKESGCGKIIPYEYHYKVAQLYVRGRKLLSNCTINRIFMGMR